MITSMSLCTTIEPNKVHHFNIAFHFYMHQQRTKKQMINLYYIATQALPYFYLIA